MQTIAYFKEGPFGSASQATLSFSICWTCTRIYSNI